MTIFGTNLHNVSLKWGEMLSFVLVIEMSAIVVAFVGKKKTLSE
jgi:hypothetical protein